MEVVIVLLQERLFKTDASPPLNSKLLYMPLMSPAAVPHLDFPLLKEEW